MTRIRIANIVLIAGLSVLLAGAAYFGWHVRLSAHQQQEIKQDYSLTNSVTFGLFSIDSWREKLSEVMDDRINGYSITPEQKKAIRIAVEKELHGLVAKTVAEINKPQKSMGGKLKKVAFHALVDSNTLQAQVKPFAKTIVQKVSSPESQARLKDIASTRINHLERQTYDESSEAIAKITKYVYAKYHVNSPETFNNAINNRLKIVGKRTVTSAEYMLACVLAAVLLWVLMRNQVHLRTTLFVMSLLFATVLLIVGLTTPVIEVDARIQSLDLTLLGEKIQFINQVLFFQSKSIWEVILTLLQQQKPDAITVGILILLFIVILPFMRLTAKGLHLFIRDNKVINYIAFEMAKWDMADVMIVGILMTYIGLNGILKSELGNLNIHSGSLNTVTVNNSSLQPGYFIFAGYVIFELILSIILKRISDYQSKPKRNPKIRTKIPQEQP